MFHYTFCITMENLLGYRDMIIYPTMIYYTSHRFSMVIPPCAPEPRHSNSVFYDIRAPESHGLFPPPKKSDVTSRHLFIL